LAKQRYLTSRIEFQAQHEMKKIAVVD